MSNIKNKQNINNNKNINTINNDKEQKKQHKQIGDFIIGKVLGQGTFGKVRLAVHKHTRQKVAIKFLQKKKISQVADVQRVSRQIHILKLIRHPNLVQLYQIIQTPKQLLLIMQYMQNGQLFDYIVKKSRISQDEACKMFHQIIDGVQYIHNIGITHRDLKPQNILLNYNNSLKIVDFGLSNTYKKGQLLKTPCGSPCYAAPQMIQGQKYEGIRVDIWSCGIILFAMLCGYLPFQDQNVSTLYKKILQGDYSFHRKVSQQAKDLIKRILNNNVKQRYSIQQIRNHSWMKKGLNSEIRSKQGIIIGYNKIPVDKQIIRKTLDYANYDIDYMQKCLQANRHNQQTVLYYLTMKAHIKNGGISKYDMANQNFDKKSIQPIKRKDNLTEILIDNFITKNSYNQCSIDLSTNNIQRKLKNQKLSKQKQKEILKNNENSFYINRRISKSKQKQRQRQRQRQRSKQKQKSKQKQRSQRQSRNNSKIRQSLNQKSTIRDKQSSFCLTSLSKYRQRNKSKQSKIDKSVTYTNQQKINHQRERSIQKIIINKKLKYTGVNDKKRIQQINKNNTNNKNNPNNSNNPNNPNNSNNPNNKAQIVYSKKKRCDQNPYYETIDYDKNIDSLRYNGIKMINSIQNEQIKQNNLVRQRDNKYMLQNNLHKKYKQKYNQSIVSKSRNKSKQIYKNKQIINYQQNKQNIDVNTYSKLALSNKINMFSGNSKNIKNTTTAGKVQYKNYNTSIILNNTTDLLNSSIHTKKIKHKQMLNQLSQSGFVQEYLAKGKRNLGSQQKQDNRKSMMLASSNYGLNNFKSIQSATRGTIKHKKML